VLRAHDLGLPASTGLDIATKYIRWFSAISHSYIITSHDDVHIPRPHEEEARDVIVVGEHGDQQWLDMTERLRRIRTMP
jgi:hypothetical protein